MQISFPRLTLAHYNALCVTAILFLNAKDPVKDYWRRNFGAISSLRPKAIGSAPVVAETAAAAATTTKATS